MCVSRRPDCHHDAREPHHCHFGRCPPCQRPCGRPRETCRHRCAAPCHTAVWRRRQVPVITHLEKSENCKMVWGNGGKVRGNHNQFLQTVQQSNQLKHRWWFSCSCMKQAVEYLILSLKHTSKAMLLSPLEKSGNLVWSGMWLPWMLLSLWHSCIMDSFRGHSFKIYVPLIHLSLHQVLASESGDEGTNTLFSRSSIKFNNGCREDKAS